MKGWSVTISSYNTWGCIVRNLDLANPKSSLNDGLITTLSRGNLSWSLRSSLSYSLNWSNNFLVFRVWNWLLEWIFILSFSLVYLQLQHSFIRSCSSSIWAGSSHTSCAFVIDTAFSFASCTNVAHSTFAWVYSCCGSDGSLGCADLSSDLKFLKAVIKIGTFAFAVASGLLSRVQFLAAVCWAVTFWAVVGCTLLSCVCLKILLKLPELYVFVCLAHRNLNFLLLVH